jgi:hypothetical protein
VKGRARVMQGAPQCECVAAVDPEPEEWEQRLPARRDALGAAASPIVACRLPQFEGEPPNPFTQSRVRPPQPFGQ